MKLAIMQPYFFPYIGYFQLMHAADRFVLYDDVTFIKQGWINRNRILVNGGASYISVPIRHASSFALIRDTLIDDGGTNARWAEKMLKTVRGAYGRAPQFARVFPVVEAVVMRATNRIADLAVASLKAAASLLDIRTEWVESSSGYGNADLRAEERVLAICRTEGATEYLNAPGGRELYAPDRFEAEGIRLRFLQPRPIEYRQFGNGFVPSLSIIDALMFNPPGAVRSLLDEYDVA